MDTTPGAARRAKWVSQEEILRRRTEKLCLRCGASGHHVAACPYSPARNPSYRGTKTGAITRTTSGPQLKDDGSDSDSSKNVLSLA